MASLFRLRKIINPLVRKNPGLLYNVVRSKIYLHDDWKPGPYPKTEEERKKAAAKYGLTPEEYEPYPDDGSGYGDYPKLPMIGRAARDPWYPWDDPGFRRNLHEPLHISENIIGEDRIDAGVKQRISYPAAYATFFGVMGMAAFLIWLFDDDQMHHPVMEKQFPKPGVVHYTFEPAR